MLAIRMARTGKRKKPSYRIVVIEKTRPRDGRFVEILGTYSPQNEPADFHFTGALQGRSTHLRCNCHARGFLDRSEGVT